jgi:hypothetical protein
VPRTPLAMIPDNLSNKAAVVLGGRSTAASFPVRLPPPIMPTLIAGWAPPSGRVSRR